MNFSVSLEDVSLKRCGNLEGHFADALSICLGVPLCTAFLSPLHTQLFLKKVLGVWNSKVSTRLLQAISNVLRIPYMVLESLVFLVGFFFFF